MKSAFTSILIFVLTLNINAQKLERINQLTKYNIAEAYDNGINESSIFTSENAFTLFYTKESSDTIWLANIWAKSKTASFGPISPITPINFNSSSNTGETEYFTFSWFYQNTYNKDHGNAQVTLKKVYGIDKIFYEMSMKLQNEHLIILKGEAAP